MCADLGLEKTCGQIVTQNLVLMNHEWIVYMKNFWVFLFLFIMGCVSVPEGVQPVRNFNASRYLGKWYEIARLDHSFERGLSNVYAEYSLRPDGGIRVLNRGYSETKGEWKEAEGKAYFVEDASTGNLKVSFFGPFYGSYIIMDIDDEAYSSVLVCGPDRSYLWILSRTPDLGKERLKNLIDKAHKADFDTNKLIMVNHDRMNQSETTKPQ